MKSKRIAVILPAADEEETIEQFISELRTIRKKIRQDITFFFVVDKVSTPETISILKKLSKKYPDVKTLYEPKDKNVVDAYIHGFKTALRKKYDYIIDMDCGFSHLPTDLPAIVKPLLAGYDCVFGIRPLASPSYTVPFSRRLYSFGGTLLANILLDMHYRDATSGFNGYTANALQTILKEPILSTGNFWHTEMRYRARHFRYKEIPIHYSAPSNRVRGKTLRDSFSVLFSLAKKRFVSRT